MAEPAPQESPAQEAPRYDPHAIERRLAHERAKREARLAHKRGRRYAGIRFFVVILVLLGLTGLLAFVVWHEIQRLFGI